MSSKSAKEQRDRRGIGKAAMAVILLLCITVTLRAQPEKDNPKKPAWKWTIDERVAARFDPEAIEAREAERQAEVASARKRFDADPLAEEAAQMRGQAPVTETIDGNKTPELFLPGELFGMLLYRGFPPEEEKSDAQDSRRRIEERAASLGFGRDLWDRLEKVAFPYLRIYREEYLRRRATRTNDYEKDEDKIRLCRLQARALEAAKSEFGEEAFLRLLYEAVAPNTRQTYILEPGPADYPRYAKHLQFLEVGCR